MLRCEVPGCTPEIIVGRNHGDVPIDHAGAQQSSSAIEDEAVDRSSQSRKGASRHQVHEMVLPVEMESHRSVTGQSLWRVRLSARRELHPHPLAEQAQACGRLTKAEGLEGPMAPIVTTGGYIWEKTAFLARHPCTGGHASLLCIVERKEKPSNCGCLPCVGSMLQILRIEKKPGIVRVFVAQEP